MTTLDVLIAIPLIPLILVFITWWLPWERCHSGASSAGLALQNYECFHARDGVMPRMCDADADY